MNKQSHLLGAVSTLLLMLCAVTASAASGFAKSTFSTWNMNGNYSDPGLQTCTGHRYHVDDWDEAQLYRNSRVEIWQGANVIGVGQADNNGVSIVSWSSSSLTNARIRWIAQHGSGAFVIADTTGARMNNNSATFTLTNGTTAGAPQ